MNKIIGHWLARVRQLEVRGDFWDVAEMMIIRSVATAIALFVLIKTVYMLVVER